MTADLASSTRSLSSLLHCFRILQEVDVKLQPPTARGIADFEATIHGFRFVVEASIFSSDIFADARFRIPRIITSAVESAVRKQYAIAVQVQFHE
jgi:hypothetical protein